MKPQLLFLTVTIIVTLMGCEVDPPLNLNSVNTDQSKTIQEFLDKNKTPSQTFRITSDTINKISGVNGTIVSFPANAFADANYNLVNGQIEIEFREVFDKSQFILSNVPTITDNGKILKSAGAFYLKARQNGVELKLIKPIILGFIPSQPDPNMQLYYGIQADGAFQWTNVQNQFSGSGVVLNTFRFPLSYSIYINPLDSLGTNPFTELGWLNCDDTISDTLPTTSITVSVGNGYDDVHTATYIVFDDINSVMRVYNLQDSTFISPTNIPVTFNVTIVTISINENETYLATKAIKVEQNHFERLTPIKMSEEELISRLEQLNE